MPVCGQCQALYTGGDGRHCPTCGHDESASGNRARATLQADQADEGPTIPASAPGFPPRPGQRAQPAIAGLPAAPLAPLSPPGRGGYPGEPTRRLDQQVYRGLLLVLLVLISTSAGLRGHLWIWRLSIPADIVFTLGTMLVGWGAYRIASRGMHWALLAGLGGFFAHWVVYATSWRLVAWDLDEGGFFAFVFEVGIWGLVLAAVLPPGLAAIEAHRASLRASVNAATSR